MQPNYGRPPYSPPTPGYQSSQSPDGLTHHSYDGVGSSFSLPTRGRGDHSSMQHSLQNPIISAHTQGAQPPTPTTTASSDSFARPSGSYYQTTPTTSHPLSYPGFTSSAPSHSTSGTTGTYSRGIPAYSPQSHNHSVPSSPMQATYSSRSYSNSFTLPTMAGPVLSNMSNPGGQMALVGGITAMPHGYHSGHHLSQHPMYSASPHNPRSDRPFKCDTCNAAFNRNHDLKRHTRIHLAIKPFPCTFCDKSFSRKDALKRHILVKGCGGGKNEANDRSDSLPPEHIKPEED
ncbi:hypothetical protein GGR53DRAFT_291806 [Hypoxylon sp. FL1150]|nr:hypothetical protein GGR53DRAFT_291806 [Hypoxylon sp. FL1150]